MAAFPRWALVLMNLAVIGGLWLVAETFKAAGWQIALGWALGNLSLLCLFRWHYGWWPDFNMDGEDQANSRLPRIDPDRTNWR